MAMVSILYDQFVSIGVHEPVDAGDLISKEGCEELIKKYNLVQRTVNEKYVLTAFGKMLFSGLYISDPS